MVNPIEKKQTNLDDKTNNIDYKKKNINFYKKNQISITIFVALFGLDFIRLFRTTNNFLTLFLALLLDTIVFFLFAILIQWVVKKLKKKK